MDAFSLIRTLGALAFLLGLLSAALWAVKRYDLRLPGRVTGGGSRRRVELVEKMAIDAKRSVALIRRDGQEHLILLGPEGQLMIESGIAAEKRAVEPAPTPVHADLAALRGAFGRLVEKSGVVASRAESVAVAEEVEAEDEPDVDISLAWTHTAQVIELHPAKREFKRPRDTKRWNRARVREALNG